ncbi:hypothetical protein [Streptomyces albogriseolus]|uniref:hypothetical protein n=1 Tax=Streptomyces albogriseolus TaxID=1887 RepID=UPI00379A05FC
MPSEDPKGDRPPVTGYRVLLPSQWEQIPLRRGTEGAVRRILDAAFSAIPENAPQDKIGPYKHELERRLRAAVTQAQRGNALDLYLPVKPTAEVNLGASIVVSEELLRRHRKDANPDDPTQVAIQLLSQNGDDGGDWSSGEIDGALAVRREHVVQGDPGKGIELASRRVEYIVSVPDDPNRWFISAFSTVGDGDLRDDLSEALVEWFDAVMATFRWRRE